MEKELKQQKKAWNKARRKAVRPWKGMSWFSGILSILLVVLTVVVSTYDNTVSTMFGQSFQEIVNADENAIYYERDFDDIEESEAYKNDLCERLEGEGAVLLMNENNTLPLESGSKVSCFSNSSVNLVYGGTGSGNVDTTGAPTLKDALTDSGFQVNETLWSFYTEGAGSEYVRDSGSFFALTPASTCDVPWDVYTEDVIASAEEYSDAAIVTIGRVGGEGVDLTSSDINYLQLDAEEIELLTNLGQMKADGKISKIIVLINSANAFEMDFLLNEAYGIDACMWIGDVGQTGINAVADILAGIVVPSGSLPVTYCYDNFTSPAMVNFPSKEYSNATEYDIGLSEANYYYIYQEGIYVGYRYYETRYEDYVMSTGNAGDFVYGSQVAFPFGYGLSYTEFAYSDMTVNYNATTDQFEIQVMVTNTGDTYAGKEVVQIYGQSPYTEYDVENHIEKSAVALVGFEKTDVLEPGQSETLTIYVDKRELASYDSYGAGTYILEAGDYYFTAATDAHNAANNILAAKGYSTETTENRMDGVGSAALAYKWTNDTFDSTTYATSATTGYEIENQFDHSDLNRYEGSGITVTYLSRNDWTGTYPTEIQSLELTEQMVADLQDIQYDPADYSEMEMPTMDADNGLKLVDMIGLSYDDPKWVDLLDQLTFDEMAKNIGDGFHWQMPVESVDAPATRDENGPMGMTAGLLSGESAMSYTSEDVMAATFNKELMEEIGRSIGDDCLGAGVSFLYGTGNNLHRTPYGGRNFEYYSEDGFLSGAICAAEVKGIESKGIGVLMKHFALNDHETNRLGCCVWTTEQAIREIYLKAFQAPVEESDANGVMTAYVRFGCTWAGGDYNLITNVLRNEWGCEGKIITDNTAYDSMAYMNGVDGILSGGTIFDAMLTRENHFDDYKDDAVVVNAMREAVHRNLYATANSSAMNGIGADTEIKAIEIPVLTTLKVLSGVFMLLFVVSLYLAITKTRKYYKENPKPVR